MPKDLPCKVAWLHLTPRLIKIDISPLNGRISCSRKGSHLTILLKVQHFALPVPQKKQIHGTSQIVLK